MAHSASSWEEDLKLQQTWAELSCLES
jgi:hypothetical protein